MRVLGQDITVKGKSIGMLWQEKEDKRKDAGMISKRGKQLWASWIKLCFHLSTVAAKEKTEHWWLS